MPLNLLKQLDKRLTELNYKEKTKDAPHVAERCEHTYRVFDAIRNQLEQLAPSIEQLKGLTKGFKVAQEIVGQHKEIFKKECEDEKIEKEEFWAKAKIIDAAVLSLKDATIKQREEFLQTAGRGNGLYQSAGQALDQIQTYLANLEAQENFMNDDPSFNRARKKKEGEVKEKDEEVVVLASTRKEASGGNGKSKQVANVKDAKTGDLTGATISPFGKPKRAKSKPKMKRGKSRAKQAN